MVVFEGGEGNLTRLVCGRSELRLTEKGGSLLSVHGDGPESLLAPIEAEFAKRGLSPFAMAFD